MYAATAFRGNRPLKSTRTMAAALFIAVSAHGAEISMPTGAQLLDACRHALAVDFTGIEGALCLWYSTPCDCGTEPGTPELRYCPAAPLSDTDHVRVVVQGLAQDPGLWELPAAQAASRVLAGRFPCP